MSFGNLTGNSDASQGLAIGWFQILSLPIIDEVKLSTFSTCANLITFGLSLLFDAGFINVKISENGCLC